MEVPMRRYDALIDTGTGAVLSISAFWQVLTVLREFTPDSSLVSRIQSPHYEYSFFHNEPLFLLRCESGTYPHWTWRGSTRTFVPTHRDVLTDELIKKSRLAVAKTGAITEVIRKINQTRLPLTPGISFQDHIYARKAAQARSLVRSAYEEHSGEDYSYVMQYAEIEGITPKEAADDIVFKARLDEDVLLRTEGLRLRFFKRLREASRVEEVEKILEDFKRDCRSSAPISL